jgi:hypothetical protein
MIVGGALPVAGDQIESFFAEEELFSALQVSVLSLFTGLLMVARALVCRFADAIPVVSVRHRVSVTRRTVILVSLVAVMLCCALTVYHYRHSFYPAHTPMYPGITWHDPFLCGVGIPDDATPTGEVTFERLLARVAANPDKEAPEYGMLALVTRDREWAEAFRRALLLDVRTGRYAGPANSIKYGQALAARRVYYYARVAEAFPDLFSADDESAIRSWLGDVNRRAWTVEWVDWMYALAFSVWPLGPYENQENGAGLLAAIETVGLVDDALSARNRTYLEENQRGWFQRFRNTDDAYVYQAEWISNALFQQDYWSLQNDVGPRVARNRAMAFEWLLLQSLPSGASLRYNFPVDLSLAQTAYLGAVVLQDPRYIWWSSRMLDWAERTDSFLYAQPGLEQMVPFAGESPQEGTCLIFGDSGLPTQEGPLAPDKIVFREGWTPESAYLLLNLRFSGWHRYKATNTITLIDQAGALVRDQDQGERFAWLPEGRSHFRDKRIPRENLNGLIIPKTGIASVLYGLTGLGGPWAQDPPRYAEVVAFETGPKSDFSHTRLVGWRGWQHDRWVRFYHGDGLIVVVDEARGPASTRAALTWHFGTEASIDDWRIHLRGGAAPAEAVLVPIDSQAEGDAVEWSMTEETGQQLRYYGQGQLRLATVFLWGAWVDAEVKWEGAENSLVLSNGDTRIVVPVEHGE